MKSLALMNIINKELSKHAGFQARLPRSITIVLELGL